MLTPTTFTAPMDTTSRLLGKRIVFLGSEVTDESANRVAADILLLAAEDTSRDIFLYINSPGGSVSAGLAIYDVMQHVPNDIVTVGMGLAASMGQFLLTAGAKGKRYALPNARVMMHQPLGGIGGTQSDIKIQAEQMGNIKLRLATLISEHSGQDLSRIQADSERDSWFTAEEAAAYGLIDSVLAAHQTPKGLLS
jgi:ATP-dependent Clp protease protease subunit